MSKAKSTESIPWHLDLSWQDMEILIRSRLPESPTVKDVIERFGAKVTPEWIQVTRKVTVNWFKEHNWVVKFYYDRDSQLISKIDVRRMSGW